MSALAVSTTSADGAGSPNSTLSWVPPWPDIIKPEIWSAEQKIFSSNTPLPAGITCVAVNPKPIITDELPDIVRPFASTSPPDASVAHPS